MQEQTAGKIQIGSYVVGAVQTNFYYLWREGSTDAVAVDPGDYGKEICEALREKGLSVCAILVTHAHFDHFLGVKAMKEISGAPVYAPLRDKPLFDHPEMSGSLMGFPVTEMPADYYVREGEEITAGGITFKVLETPGHTEGSCCFYIEEGHLLLSGDTLFAESVGRTDFPTGSMSKLVRSIKEKLFVLPDDTKVYPGHMGLTTIGHEKKYNWFVK